MELTKKAFIIFFLYVAIVAFAFNMIEFEHKTDEPIVEIEQEVIELDVTPMRTARPTISSTEIPTPTPMPITPTDMLIAENVSPQEFYDACLSRGMVTGVNEEDHITKERGGCMGASGRETYYNLNMSKCVSFMRELGYSEEEYPYWIRDDGAKMLGLYVMCAANWKIRPKGTIIPTSLGDAIVVDTGEFVADFPYGVDLAVDW